MKCLLVEPDNRNEFISLQNAMSGLQQSLTNPYVSMEERRQKLLLWLNAVFTDDNYDAAIRSRHVKTCDWMLQRSQYRDWETPDDTKSKLLWIEQAYEKDLERISKLRKDKKDRAIATLRWILFAVRPLTVREMCEVLALTFNDVEATYPSQDDLPECWSQSYVDEDYVNDVIRLPCGSLVELRSKFPGDRLDEQTVHFVHFSVKEYLLRPTADGGPPAKTFCLSDSKSEHTHLARLCLQYLCYDVFGDDIAPYEMALGERIRPYPFLKYAARSWYRHVSHRDGVSEDVMSYTEKLFSPVTSNWITWSRVFEAELHDTTGSDSDSSESSSEPGIDSTDDTTESESTTEGRDDKKQTLDTTESENKQQTNAADLPSKVSNPVYYAAFLGFTDVIKALHAQGLDCSEIGGRYGFPLQAAIVNGQHAAVETLLDLGADFASHGGQWEYAILAAAALRSEAVFQRLIKAGAKTAVQDKDGFTCLHVASRNGAISIVKWLLESQMDVDILITGGETPLYWACSCGHGEVVRLLLRHGCNANVKTSSGMSPLHVATIKHYKEIIDALLTDGVADVNASTNGGSTCLHFATHLGNEEITQLLLTYRADPNVKDTDGWSSLHSAVESGSTCVAKLLLDNEAQVNQMNNRGQTPLHLAVSSADEATTRLLLGYGANVNSADDPGRWTSPHMAISNGWLPLCRLLLDNAADTKIADHNSCTVLDYAVELGNKEAVLLLLEYGAGSGENTFRLKSATGHATLEGVGEDIKRKLNLQTLKRDLHKAAFSGVEKDVIQLLKITPVPDLQDAVDSSLHMAAAGGSETIVVLLLDRGANVNSKGGSGRTALHQAAARDSRNISQLLLNHGAQVDAEDVNGCKAIDLAARRGLVSLNTVELLTKHNGAFGKINSGFCRQAEAMYSGKASDFPAPSNAPEKTEDHTLSGKWLGTYTYTKLQKGEQEATEFDITPPNEKPSAAKNILKGQGKDADGDYQICGQLLDEKTVRLFKLWDTVGWLFHGDIDWTTETITGHWGRSSQLWWGTFIFTHQRIDLP